MYVKEYANVEHFWNFTSKSDTGNKCLKLERVLKGIKGERGIQGERGLQCEQVIQG
jgi:hypothetical protein